MAATTKVPVLVKDRSYTTPVKYGIHEYSTDAGWVTSDGYRVHRATDKWGVVDYKVFDRAGRLSSHDSFAGARDAVVFLREQGR